MSTINVLHKFIQDNKGNIIAPITMPTAVLFPNGDDLDTVISNIDIDPTGIDTSGKASKVVNAVSGHFAGLDSNGDITDIGSNLSNVLAKVSNSNGYLITSKSDGQILLASYTPTGIINTTNDNTISSVRSTIRGYSTDNILNTLTLNSLKNYFSSLVAIMEQEIASISGGGGLMWRDCSSIGYNDRYVLVNSSGQTLWFVQNGSNYGRIIIKTKSNSLVSVSGYVYSYDSYIAAFGDDQTATNWEFSNYDFTFDYSGTTYVMGSYYGGLNYVITPDVTGIYDS